MYAIFAIRTSTFPLLFPFLRSGRCGAIDVGVMDEQVEGLDSGVGWVAAVHGLAVVADDDVLHESPDDVVQDRYAEERKAVGPGNEDRAENDESDASPAVEVLLEV